ncbi:hypothetical protein ACFFVB_01705 [Formosa undariae]|uniref:Lipoprotein n=1 Tax=Formosa undariae TaxID=1325436 RepID=A0ABV5EX66_9FLAO
MKHLTLLVSLILFSACGLTKKNSEKTQNSVTPSESAITQNDVLVEYTAITRGMFLKITIENQEIRVQKEQYSPDKSRTMSDSEWDILMDQLDGVDLNTLSSLEAPSMKRTYDGAAAARLEITEADLKYSTSEFDHNNPNTKIKPLVEFILSLAKTVE